MENETFTKGNTTEKDWLAELIGEAAGHELENTVYQNVREDTLTEVRRNLVMDKEAGK